MESAALRVDSQSGLTNKARVIGKLRCRNAGIGIHLADEADVNLTEYVYKAITSKAAYLIDDSKLHIDECILDFRNNPRSLSARDAFVMDDASQITIGRLIIRQGAESDQPTAIFKDNDNVSGKLVDIQHLIYDDPDNVGPIPLVTLGREGNFTWLSSRFKHYVAGRYYFPQFFIGTGSAGAVSAGRLYAVPMEIHTPTTFTKIGINVTTGATGSPAPARLGIYKDQKGVPGALVVDAGEVDVTTIAAVEATISKTLFGKYWLAVIFESASSLQITLQSSASTNVGDYGAEGPVGGANVLRPSVTYGPLPSTYPSVTSASFETANIPRIRSKRHAKGAAMCPSSLAKALICLGQHGVWRHTYGPPLGQKPSGQGISQAERALSLRHAIHQGTPMRQSIVIYLHPYSSAPRRL